MNAALLKTWSRRAAWLALVVLLLLIAAWTVLNVVGSLRWERAIGDLRDAGLGVTLEALVRPPAAASENAAPYYTAAFGLQVAENPAGAFDKSVRGMSDEERARLREWLAKNRESFDMVARGGKRPVCRFERDYRQGYAMLLPELGPMIKLGEALQLRAELQAFDGDAVGARDSIRSIFTLADSQKTEPLLILQLVRATLHARALKGLAACVTADTPEAELREWRAIVPDPDVAFAGSLQAALRGDMAMAIDLMSRPSPDILGTELPPLRGAFGWLFRPWLRWDGSRYLSLMRRAADASVRPYPEARADFAEFDQVFRSSSPWTQPMCSLLLPALSRALDATTAARARLATARAGLAATGRAPAPVTELNPFTGKPLILDAAAGKIVCDGVPEGQEPIVWVIPSK